MKRVANQSSREARANSSRGIHHQVPDLSDAYTMNVVTDLEGVTALAECWDDLLPRTAAPFQTHTWNLAWYRNFAESYDEILVFEVLFEGERMAILPCYRTGRQIRLAGDIVCDFQDLITSERRMVGPTLRLANQWIQKQEKRSYFFFEKLSSDGFLYDQLENRGWLPKRTLSFRKRYAPCPWVDLEGGCDAYLSSMPRKMRGDLRRALNRLKREVPEAVAEIHRGPEVKASYLEEIVNYHCEHFRKDGISPLADRNLVRMLHEVAADAAVGLQVSELSDRGDTLAIDIGFARGGKYYGYLTGFDETYRKLAPGKCLLLKRIDEWVQKDGVEILDFLCGDEDYKVKFTKGEAYEVHSIHLMSDEPLHQIAIAGRTVNHSARQLAKKVIAGAGLAR